MYAMLSDGEESILVNVKAVGKDFPFYGEIELTSGKRINSNLKMTSIKKRNYCLGRCIDKAK